ncbi:PAS domain S-box-containing protein [Natronoarchaeum philippinense]|uniref:PAS domain S-box-containing protein n=1 Tax=Natronoarchaeum philippinense TaxID=558529 RepID=A0A285NSK8_NATPI|nr:bacterio-opsin activator domain-containing protein [Natronoarchaeum philippinense]SNZ11967.1 PAS domain S-box-containing protein [Natronoarchaeum philippinense]
MDKGDPSRAGEELVAVFEGAEPGEPHTAREIADELGWERSTADETLQELAESGVLETKLVGDRERVWWLPPPTDHSRADVSAEPTERSREYQDLVASEQQYRAVFEEAFDAILIADDEARYVEVNPAACELFGLPREELLGRTIAEFAADGYDFEEAWQEFQISEADRGLFPLFRADGEQRIVEFAATPNILPGRHLSVIRDITERREATEELEQQRKRTRQYQKTLTADTVIQLEIEVDDAVFDRLSEHLDCKCEFEGLVTASNGRLLQYVTVVGASSEDVLDVMADRSEVYHYRVVFESDSSTLLEFAAKRSPAQTLVEAGASCRSIRSERGVTTIVAELGADLDLQRLINQFTAEYPDATVVAKRRLDRPIVTTRQYRETLVDSLTDRQIEALRAAYLAGYFEWPRSSQAERIASSMDIATSTWLRHLRLAEDKLVRWFFEELEV